MGQCGMRSNDKRKGIRIGRKGILVCVMTGFLLAVQPTAGGRRPQDAGVPRGAGSNDSLSMEREEALGLLTRVAHEMNSDFSNPDALVLEAHVAGKIWDFDEPAARSAFSSAFRAALRLSQEEFHRDVPEEARVRERYRRAAMVREIVRLYAIHDGKGAEAWIKTIEEASDDQSEKSPPGSSSNGEAEVLAEIALDLVKTDPNRALRLGLQSLAGVSMPAAFGRLLFALRREKKALSDQLFRAALTTLARNGYTYDSALLALTNDVFNAEGKPLPDASPSDARLLFTFFTDAVGAHVSQWRAAQTAGLSRLSDSSARMQLFLTTRALPILRINDAEAVPVVEPLLQELSSGLNSSQQALQRQLLLSSTEQARLSGLRELDLETQLEEARKEKDSSLRDTLLRGAALKLARIDPQRALSIAADIVDAGLRAQTQDDTNLVLVASKLKNGAYDEARRIALGINGLGLQARILSELASAAIAKSGDMPRAGELLGESKAIALKAENSADKLQALLIISEGFSRIDVMSAFDVLSSVVTTVNNIRKNPDRSQVGSQPARLTITVITTINGKEVSAGEKVTLDSINFKEAGSLAKLDFTRARLLGEGIHDGLLRAKYLFAVGSAVLDESTVRLAQGDLRK